MEIKIMLKRIILTTIIFLGLANVLFAQQIIQRFTWQGHDYALQYEVIIERDHDGMYRRLLRVFTEDPFIEVTLLPGSYRMRIVPYDFRDLPVQGTRWRTFDITPPRPEQDSSIPSLFNLGEVVSTSPNLEPVPLYQTVESEPAAPKEIPLDFFANLSWMPFIPLFPKDDDLHKASALGAAVRFSAFYSKEISTLYFGLEFAGAWYNTKNVHTMPYFYKVNHLSAGLNLLAQKRFDNETALTFRLGMGVGFTSINTNAPENLKTSGVGLPANIGVSFMYPVHERFFAEAGLDYTQYFIKPAAGALRPWLGVTAGF